MVGDYISREAAVLAIDVPNVHHGIIDALQENLRDIPTADVVEVRHERWNDKAVAFYRKCSECGCCVEWNKKPFLFGDGEYNYCPNCGAKMDLPEPPKEEA